MCIFLWQLKLNSEFSSSVYNNNGFRNKVDEKKQKEDNERNEFGVKIFALYFREKRRRWVETFFRLRREEEDRSSKSSWRRSPKVGSDSCYDEISSVKCLAASRIQRAHITSSQIYDCENQPYHSARLNSTRLPRFYMPGRVLKFNLPQIKILLIPEK